MTSHRNGPPVDGADAAEIVNVTSMVRDVAARAPDRVALVEGRGRARREITYGELLTQAATIAAQLESLQIGLGDAVLILHPPTSTLYATIIALMARGSPALFVDPGAPARVREHACRAVQPRAFLGVPAAHLLRWVTPSLREIPVALTTSRVPIPGVRQLRGAGAGGHADALTLADVPSQHPALLTFTSGTTGHPKGAVRSHQFLRAQHAALAATIGAREGARDLVAFPMVVLLNLAAGVTSVLPDADLARPDAVDPAPLLVQIDREQVTRCSMPPAMCARLAAASAPSDARWRTVTEILTGGGPVHVDLLAALRRVAPQARLRAAYGSTEAEPIAEYEATEISAEVEEAMRGGAGLFAGTAVPPVRMRIIRATWGVPLLPMTVSAFEQICCDAGEPGEIVVAGSHVLKGYLNGVGDEETKFRVGATVWHRTGDVGRCDAEGRLWLLGRAAHTITDARGPVYPLAVEAAARSCWPSHRVAFAGVGNTRVLAVEGALGALDLSTVQSTLRWAGIDQLASIARIPTDSRHNSKVDYARLVVMLSRRGERA
jgi:olefin beta-lactone synthetase